VLTEAVSGGTAVLVCAGGIAAVTALVTVNATLRRFPRRGPDPAVGLVSAESSG
jgi:hypothetical protein